MLRSGVLVQSSREECIEKAQRPPVSTRWFDIDTDKNSQVDIRSRRVARDFNLRGERDRFDTFVSRRRNRLLCRLAADLANKGRTLAVLCNLEWERRSVP